MSSSPVAAASSGCSTNIELDTKPRGSNRGFFVVRPSAWNGGKPQRGYGRCFVTADGRADLTVQSISNDTGDSPAVFLAKNNPPPNIEYQRVTPRFFVESSFRGDKICYNGCNFVGHVVNCVLINYPAVEKRQWDGVVTRISNTLASR